MILLGKRINKTNHRLDTWLNEIQIQKAIDNGGKVDLGACIVEIINDNLARAIYEDGGYEEYTFVRKVWAVHFHISELLPKFFPTPEEAVEYFVTNKNEKFPLLGIQEMWW